MMTIPQMSPTEARALANFVARIRNRSGGPPWDAHGIEYALGEARGMADPFDLAVATIRAAQLAQHRTPAVIGMRGPHWREAEGPVKLPPEPTALLCADCGKTRDDCERAYAAHLPDRHVYRPAREQQPAEHPDIAAVRAAWREGRVKLCEHGARVCPDCPGFQKNPHEETST